MSLQSNPERFDAIVATRDEILKKNERKRTELVQKVREQEIEEESHEIEPEDTRVTEVLDASLQYPPTAQMTYYLQELNLDPKTVSQEDLQPLGRRMVLDVDFDALRESQES